MVCAECDEEGCATIDGRCVKGASATVDDWEDVCLCTWPTASKGVGNMGVFISDKLRSVRGVNGCTSLPFPYLNFFNRGLATSGVRVTDELGFKEVNKVGFLSGGSELGRR
jgi:hypothetical protein